ncbi:MAG: hypothetical protein ACTHOH_06790 [Lysobacteraceae bacterium]
MDIPVGLSSCMDAVSCVDGHGAPEGCARSSRSIIERIFDALDHRSLQPACAGTERKRHAIAGMPETRAFRLVDAEISGRSLARMRIFFAGTPWTNGRTSTLARCR